MEKTNKKQLLLTENGDILDAHGVIHPGYATAAPADFVRKAIKAPPWRIKEWDFYQVSDGEKCLQFTFGHASYIGQVCCMLFDFKQGKRIATVSRLLPLPFGRLNMPENAEKDQDILYDKNGLLLQYEVRGDKRLLRFCGGGLLAEVELVRKNPRSIVISIPFDEYKTAFYYNHKINCMTARGKAKFGGQTYTFGEDAFGLLDWGRGVWPFHNEWYWSNGTGLVDGEMLGFNLGCGFGNTDSATENILFYKNAAHKLGRVYIEHGPDYMQPWKLYDADGRVDLTLTPWYDRTTRDKVLFVDNECHQMFGAFNGKVVLDDGTALPVRNLVAFAEHAVNNW